MCRVPLGTFLRVGRLVRLFGDELQEVEALEAGDIGSILGGPVRTGETLASSADANPLEGIDLPDPVMHLALAPVRSSERENLAGQLSRLLLEDPSLVAVVDSETGEQLLGGLGELHLEVSLEKLRQRTGLCLRAGAPKVALRSALGASVQARYRHAKQTGGPGQFAEVHIELEPSEDEFAFEDRTRGGVVPGEYIKGVKAGAKQALRCGPVGGWPVEGVKVILLDGETHVRDSSEQAFFMAGKAATEMALGRASLQLLEPSMRLELEVPSQTVGKVVADLQRRRGSILSLREDGALAFLKAIVPLAELFGYAGGLAALTHGRGIWSSVSAGFAQAPASVTSRLLNRAG